MRILVVTQYFWPENFLVNDLVRELVARGHTVSVLTGKPNYPSGQFFPDFLADPTRYDQYYGATIYRVPIPPRGKSNVQLLFNYIGFAISACVLGPLLLRRLSFDIIFAFQLSPVFIVLPASILSFVKRCPLAVWVQDLWPDSLVALGVISNTLIISTFERLVAFLYNRAHLIFLQSPGFLVRFKQYYNDISRVVYLPNWSSPQPSLMSVERAPEVPHVDGCLTIMFTGNLGDAQDLGRVLDAASSLSSLASVRWVFIGEGRKSAWLRRETIRRKLEHCVFQLGRYPVERMPSFYKCADVLLVSLAESPAFALTIPSKVQSYMMSGRPLLGMLNGEGSALINSSSCGLTCPAGDSEALASCVLKFLEMPARDRDIMGANAYSYALNNFSKNSVIDKLERHLYELVDC